MRLIVLAVLLLAAPATATPKPSALVLELVPTGKTKGIDPGTVALAKELSQQLRTHVAGGGRYTLGLPKRTTDEQIDLARECLPRAPACWASIAKELATHVMFYGTVEKVGDRYHVIVKRQLTGSTNHVQKAVFEVIRIDATTSLLRLQSKEIYMKLVGDPIPQTR